ncbi:MAG: chromosome segregation protein SMC [Firmicutes bacterium]|nr:chromosome segregation protein SMC [Bacillota bacterium]
MYLKGINLLGFKSFSGKTKISLEQGISCIVGPNGSGKSNIVDALRWVMGEQSARSIRGGKMEDVIFSGSKKRRALGMAEVSILLDNSDGYLPLPFSEISVSRRALRGGGSEYYINEQACRLKDVRDLFVDSGVGVDGVSIINQGRINELVNAKPDERRALVEEAAGIVKYRDRKREALRKLADTERHLERLGDILGELSGRIGPLQLQSQRAQEYLRLKEEADRMEMGISVRVLSEAEEKIGSYDQEIHRAEEALLQDETARLATAAEAADLRLQLAALDEEAAQASEDFHRLQREQEKLAGEQKLNESNLQNAEENFQRWSRELCAVEEGIAARTAQAQALQEQLSQIQQELQEQEAHLLSGEGSSADLRGLAALREERFNSLGREQAELQASLAVLEKKIDLQQEQAEKQRQNRSKTEVELQQSFQEQEEANQLLEEAELALSESMAESRRLSEHLNETELAIRKLTAATQELAAEEADSRYKVHSLQTKVNMMEEMAAGYEGFFPGVKGLMTAHRKGKAPGGIIDVMSELMDVPAQYRVAIEGYLGANIQNIVVKDSQAAKAAVEYLKKNQLGRATFLPLDILKVREPYDFSRALALPGVFGRASELVSCEPAYRKAVDFLLNNMLLCDTMDTALLAAKELQYRSSVVTLDGDMVSPGATVSGGSRQNKAGDLLGKKSRLLEARKELELAKEKLSGHVQRLEAGREELRQATEENQAAREELRILSANAAEQKNRSTQQQMRLQGLSQRIAALQDQLEELADDLSGLDSSLREDAAAEKQLRQQLQGLDAEKAVAAEELALIQEQLELQRNTLTEQKMSLAAKREKQDGLHNQLRQLEGDLENLRWEAEGKAADRDAARKEHGELLEEKERLKSRLQDLALALHEAEELMSGKRHGLAAETARLQELERIDREHLRVQDQLKAGLHQSQLRRERWQADFENEAAKLAEKFQLDLAQAQARLGEDIPSRTAMGQRLNQLRREINALGSINLGAIEEYAEVSQRYEFLTGQQADMLEAKGKLDTVIREMDQIMVSRFKETFIRLSAAFNDSFNRLFGGGEASLFLSDPEDILETGVEISVHPPGKKVSNYNLLSGGEKSLIGIALMFATLEVRPTPFCFMDEVDAALDEANIDRFTAYLKDKSEGTQFVMISHRQGTMEAAGALWGVTMEEEGVSKILGVKLSDLAELGA